MKTQVKAIKAPDGFHFYASSVAEWAQRDRLDQLSFMFEDAHKFPVVVWLVPGPIDQAFRIEGYAPMVDGAFRIGSVGDISI